MTILWVPLAIWAAMAMAASAAAPESVAASEASSPAATDQGGIPAHRGQSPEKSLSPVDLVFDDIKFEMPKGAAFDRQLLTKEIEQLNGRPVKIRGYIMPSFKRRGITQFVLVRDNLECCFGPGAALYDCIVVEMQPGQATSFTVRPVSVEGVFRIREFKVDGKHLAIYRIEGRAVN